MWHAHFDPGTLIAVAKPADIADPQAVRLQALAPWLTVVAGTGSAEHALLSNGSQTIRLDLPTGRFIGHEAVTIEFRFDGIEAAAHGVTALRRLLALVRTHRFAASLAPRDPAISRGIAMLRVHDALVDGASQRDIAGVLFGERRTLQEWSGPSDSLRSRVRRLVREARAMAGGRYRCLLRERSAGRSSPPAEI